MERKQSKNPRIYLQTADPVLGGLIERITLQRLAPHDGNYFKSLVSEIISQQLSGRVADVIETRFISLFAPHAFPEPTAVLNASDETLRRTGLSYAKIAYIKNLARHIGDMRIDFAAFKKLSDEEIIALLTEVKGIGRWTAEMFLMFTMRRPDVFSHGDLGLRNAMVRLYRLRKPPARARADRISSAWKPYRTLACRYLWASIDI